jgi:hypothetical protein
MTGDFPTSKVTRLNLNIKKRNSKTNLVRQRDAGSGRHPKWCHPSQGSHPRSSSYSLLYHHAPAVSDPPDGMATFL